MALPTRAKITPLAGPNQGRAIEFHGWTGWVPTLQHVADRFRRPGTNGSGVQTLGKEARSLTVNAWRAEKDEATLEAFIASIEALQPYVCSIRDPYNRSIARARVMSSMADPKRVNGPSGSGAGTAKYLVRVMLVIERLPDA